MICKTCDELLALYERSVRSYTIAARNLKGTLGDDFKRAFEEAERLKNASHEASESLTVHWRDKHSNRAVGTGI